MADKENNKNPDPERMAALRSLPRQIVERLTRDEIEAFLFSDTWPSSLAEKLKDYQI